MKNLLPFIRANLVPIANIRGDMVVAYVVDECFAIAGYFEPATYSIKVKPDAETPYVDSGYYYYADCNLLVKGV